MSTHRTVASLAKKSSPLLPTTGARPPVAERPERALERPEPRLALAKGHLDRSRPEVPAAVEAAALDSDVSSCAAGVRQSAHARERAAMNGFSAELARLGSAFDLFVREARRRLIIASVAEMEKADAPVGEIFVRANQSMRQLQRALENVGERLSKDIEWAGKTVAIESNALAAVHATEVAASGARVAPASRAR